MHEDVLEQLVDDYLQLRGYFTRHNLKFRPRPDHPDFDRKQDSNHSDIDVLGYNPLLAGPDRVMVVSCKSWQAGFDVRAKLDEITQKKVRGGRDSWRFFRELVKPKWSEAFLTAIAKATGSGEFVYVTAVTSLRGDRALWENHPPFREALGGATIRIMTMQEVVLDVLEGLSNTVVASQLGRTLQLLKASGVSINVQNGLLRGNAMQPAALHVTANAEQSPRPTVRG
jgi:hypothetical protein